MCSQLPGAEPALKIRFQADANLDPDIGFGLLRHEPDGDYQMAAGVIPGRIARLRDRGLRNDQRGLRRIILDRHRVHRSGCSAHARATPGAVSRLDPFAIGTPASAGTRAFTWSQMVKRTRNVGFGCGGAGAARLNSAAPGKEVQHESAMVAFPGWGPSCCGSSRTSGRARPPLRLLVRGSICSATGAWTTSSRKPSRLQTASRSGPRAWARWAIPICSRLIPRRGPRRPWTGTGCSPSARTATCSAWSRPAARWFGGKTCAAISAANLAPGPMPSLH